MPAHGRLSLGNEKVGRALPAQTVSASEDRLEESLQQGVLCASIWVISHFGRGGRAHCHVSQELRTSHANKQGSILITALTTVPPPRGFEMSPERQGAWYVLYSLMKKVMWSLVDGSLLSYPGKIKHESPSVWIWHQHIYHTKVFFHVVVVKGQILSLRSQTRVLSLSWDPGHYRWIYLLGKELLPLGSGTQFFNTNWI